MIRICDVTRDRVMVGMTIRDEFGNLGNITEIDDLKDWVSGIFDEGSKSVSRCNCRWTFLHDYEGLKR